MSFIWHALVYSIPWQLQVILIAMPVAIVFYFIVKAVGWERVRPWVLPVVGVLAAIGFASRNKQAGYNDRRAEEEKALDHAEEVVEHERQDVQALPDVELQAKVDKWTRH